MLPRIVEKKAWRRAASRGSRGGRSAIRMSAGSTSGRGWCSSGRDDREQTRRARRRRRDARAAPAPALALDDPEREQPEPQRRRARRPGGRAAPSCARRGSRSASARAEIPTRRAEREVDEEDPAPVGHLDEHAAERGPQAAASAADAPQIPTPAARSSGRNSGSSSASETGTMNAAREPCSDAGGDQRLPTLGATAQSRLVTTKTPRPARKTLRRPSRSATPPAVTSSAAMTMK